MKTSGTERKARRRRGIALVLVLAFLVILFGLVTAFLLRMNTERQAAATFAASVSTTQLSDAAVNLIQGQIRNATTQGAAVAWASQPGMIRNFDTDGAMTRAYKLYSSTNLIYANGDWSAELAGDVAPSTWAADTAHWTDLNAPVMTPNPAGGTPAQVARYPILDPGALGNVEGFSVTGPPPASAINPLPMPVRWLYMLKDGTLAAPAAGTGTEATVSAATKDNPIVGRVAFWTDDETCKLNINTSSDGTYWDVPRVNTVQDKEYGRYQPARKEFQRYPGHPAMTSLAPVFFATTTGGNTAAPNPLSASQQDALYAMAPRIIGGGSNRGTAVAPGPLTPDNDRLYASVDELLFDPLRNAQLTAAGITSDRLEYAKFFLTASSRAPEITLFNTPRVAVWPLDVQTGNDFRSAYDQLLARCATINQPYYFTRSQPGSATADFPGAPTRTLQTGLARNLNLYAYLQDLSSRQIPGFGGTFLEKYPDDRDEILTLMFDYIRCTNTDDSTLASTFRYGTRSLSAPPAAKIPDSYGFNQVAPIRITASSGATQGLGRFPVITEAGFVFIACADGGDGTPGGVAGSNVQSNKTLDFAPSPATPGTRTLLSANERRVEALFLMEAFIPGQGWPFARAGFTTRVTGLNGFSITPTATGTDIPLGFPADGVSRWLQGGVYDELPWGGTMSARYGVRAARLPARGPMPADGFTEGGIAASEQSYYAYPFVSVPVTVNASAETMTLNGGTITITTYIGRNASVSDTPVQTTTITFPSATIPIPKLVTAGTTYNNNSQYRETAKEDWWTFSYDGCMPGTVTPPTSPAGLPSVRSAGRTSNWRWVGSGNAGARPGMLFREDSDVVRTMVPAHSDFRLLAAKPVVGPGEFAPHPNYNSSSIRLAHSLAESFDSSSIGMNEPAGAGQLLAAPATSYIARARPDVAIPHSNSLANGDWDNGISIVADGPYSNLPDGGNAYGLYNAGSPIVPYFMQTLTGAYNSAGIQYANDPAGDGTTGKPYYSLNAISTLFSPNRQVPSAGMFGSLPTGVMSGRPYQTLLFRPQTGHPGARDPKDHLWTDLFWMPVVEPYAVSEPFSTAGKINMNYEILPFRSIKRSTALAGLLRSERIPLIPLASANRYKDAINPVPAGPDQPRRPLIDIPKTLAQFQTTFDSGDIFRSPSQICDIHLVPVGETLATVSNASFWNSTFALTGDNSRERPYTNLLGRLTTKSNTYTVHYRVQSLKKSPLTAPNVWKEGTDRAVAEARGATLIERYINPNDPAIPDYATAANPADLGSFYKWRVVNKRGFAP